MSKKAFRSITSTPPSDADIEAAAAAKIATTVEDRARRGPAVVSDGDPPIQLAIRIRGSLARKLRQAAAGAGLSQSGYVLRALRDAGALDGISGDDIVDKRGGRR
jgi:hypothetical protein